MPFDFALDRGVHLHPCIWCRLLAVQASALRHCLLNRSGVRCTTLPSTLVQLTRALNAQEFISRLVCLQSGAKGRVGFLLVDCTHRWLTLPHHYFSAQPLFHCFYSLLLCRQSTLLTQLHTGAFNLGAYRAHFEAEQLICAS